VLPTLRDTPVGSTTKWSVLDLICQTPPGIELASHALSAGDLRMRFEQPTGGSRDYVLVRQLGPATLALQRQSIEQWARQHPLLVRRYRSIEESCGDGEFRMRLRRRPSFRLGRRPAAEVFVVARHDRRRDRVVIVESSNAELGREIEQTVGAVDLQPPADRD
jgi:hypothetical protein